MAAKVGPYTMGKTPLSAGKIREDFASDDFENVFDLSPSAVHQFIAGCSPEQVHALRAFAENGPVVHGSLVAPHVRHLGEFNKSITEYAEAFSASEGRYLFAWDDWPSHDDHIGFYAITEITHASLRAYFGLPPVRLPQSS